MVPLDSGFTHDSERVLAAIYRFALVLCKGSQNRFQRIGFELRITAFAHAEHGRIRFHDSQFSLHSLQSSAVRMD